MERYTEITALLDLMTDPVFCTKGNTILCTNRAATKLLLREGMDISEMLLTGSEELAGFTEGTLFLTLNVGKCAWGTYAVKHGELTIFTMDRQENTEALQLLALSAMELRAPLADAMDVISHLEESEDPKVLETAATLNRSLYRLLRLVGNMSDAGNPCGVFCPKQLDLNEWLEDIVRRAGHFTRNTGIRITYEGPEQAAVGFADAQLLERAVLNLLSNAVKFSPQGSTVRTRLQRRGDALLFQVTDQGSGIPEDLMGTLFRRYTRQPAIDDPRHGIGLGLLLVRSIASLHGGTVLIDHPESTGTRVTLSLSLKHLRQESLQSDRLQIDYAGEREHALIELADQIPASEYLYI